VAAKKKDPNLIERLLGRGDEPEEQGPRRKRSDMPDIKLPQRQPKRHTTDEQVIEAIQACKGNMAATARVLGLRSAYRLRKRINGKPELKEALDDAREELLGLAETALEANLIAGNMQAINSVLANFGKEAGWANEQTIRIQQGDDVELTWEHEADGPDQDQSE